MFGIRVVFAAAAATLPLLNIVNTCRPVSVHFGPQTYHQYKKELWEEALAPDPYSRPFQRVWGAINSVLGLIVNGGDFDDSPSPVLAPMSLPRQYPSSLFLDYEDPRFRALPRPYLAGRVVLNTVLPRSGPSTTQPVLEPTRSALRHPLAILSIIAPPPPSAAYAILGYVLLGGVLSSLFVLAVVILALRWAMAPTPSNIPHVPTTSVSVRPSGIPRWVPRVISNLDEPSFSPSCAGLLKLVEDLRQSSEKDGREVECQINAASVVDASHVDEIPHQSTEDVEKVEESESANSIVSVDAFCQSMVEPTLPFSPARSPELASEHIRSDTAPGAIVYQSPAASNAPASPIPGSVIYETPTATSQVSSAPSLIIYETPRNPSVYQTSSVATPSYRSQAPRSAFLQNGSYYDASRESYMGFNGRPSFLPISGYYHAGYAPAPWSGQTYHVPAGGSKTHRAW
ncbi:hypothetical protein C8R45DRAFT_591852 [Mycena sanguinolenta]|nr:hypothetical protein C8R45DRAFT_591852 [Mycena sanguinolenta]